MERSARVRLRLLGRFAAAADGDARPIDIAGKVRRGLIGYLALQPDFSETRERLAALMWGDSPDAKARQSLRQCLLDLRREFDPVAPVLKIDRDSIGLDPDTIAVDARDFLALCRSVEPADAEKAAALYGGPLLDGINGIEGFDPWLTGQRAKFEAAAAELFERLARQADRSRTGAQALTAVESLVALDPLREDAQRLRLRIVARYRGRDAALAQADAMTTMLRAELDAEPEPETAALIEEIRRSPAEPEPLTLRRRSAETASATAIGSGPEHILSRRSTLAISVAAACVGAALSVGLLSRGLPHPVAVQASATSTPHDGTSAMASLKDSAEPSWASPSLMPGVAADSPTLAQQGISAIAVLPFASDASERSPEQVMADNITGDLINDLSRVPGLRVISRATSRLYQGRTVDVAAVGAELGIRYVVEGDVRLNEGHLRVNIALTDTKSRLQMWSERFERDDANRPEIQNEIVRGLARQLHFNVLTIEEARRTPDQSRDPTIADLLAKGWGAILRGAREGFTASGADGYFEQVLRRDPDNVSALTGIGAYHGSSAADFEYADPEPHLKKAEDALRRAIELRPHNSLSYYFLAVVQKARGRPKEALALFAKTLELNPSFAPAYANSGHVLYRNGHLEQAVENIRYAMRLSPKDTNLGRWSLYLGQIEIARGNDLAGAEWLRRAIEGGVAGPASHASLAAAYALQGDDINAAKHVTAARKNAPWLTVDTIVDRAISGSEPGQEPHRLIEGLRKAFGNAS